MRRRRCSSSPLCGPWTARLKFKRRSVFFGRGPAFLYFFPQMERLVFPRLSTLCNFFFYFSFFRQSFPLPTFFLQCFFSLISLHLLLLVRLDSRCSATARIASADDEEEEGGALELPGLGGGENGDAAASVLSHLVSPPPSSPLLFSPFFSASSSGKRPRSTFCAAAAGTATPAPRAAPSSDDRRRAEDGEPRGTAPRPKTAPVAAAARAESATSAGSPRATPEPSWRAQNRAAREPKRPAPLVGFSFFVFLVSGPKVRKSEKSEKKNSSSFRLFLPISAHRIASLPIRTSLRVFSSAMARATAAEAALLVLPGGGGAAAAAAPAVAVVAAASAAASLHPQKAAPAPAQRTVFAAHSPSCGGLGGMGSPGETRAVAARQAAERRAEGVERVGGGGEGEEEEEEEEEEVDGGGVDGGDAASA